MTRAKYFLLTLIFLLSVQVQGQSLLVYHVVGKVMYNAKGAMKPLVMNTPVTANTSISVPYGGKVELLDEKSRKRIIIKKPGRGSIAQLSASEGNSVSELSVKYVAYVKKQLTNKGLTSRERYSDFATVTRKVDSLEVEPKKAEDPMMARFNKFKKSTQAKFLSYRQECNRKYTDFVRKAWAKIGVEPPIEKPVEPKVQPVVYDDTVSTSRFLFFGRKKKKADVVERDTLPARAKQPQPIEEVKQVAQSAQEREYGSMPFIFYGNEYTVRLDETKRLNLGEITPDRIADVLLHLSGQEYDNLLYDCLALRKQHNLCDWAYLLMLKEVADQFCGADTNESIVLLGYLYCQSGYKVRYAYDEDKHLYLLVACDYVIFGKASYTIAGERFYPLEEVNKDLIICTAKFPNEKVLSLHINSPMRLDLIEEDERVVTSKRYPDVSVKVAVNRSLIDFYNVYPTSFKPDQFSRWIVYAETPMNENVKEQIYPTLKQKIQGLSEYDAVSRLLNFVQTGFAYAYDDDIWGYDRAFFAEETLYYPFCDCEDRAILLTRLVRDLLGLDCVLVYYPGHLACAIHFTHETSGTFYTFNGKDYTVCDPTFINAPVGMQMPGLDDSGVKLIPINK